MDESTTEFVVTADSKLLEHLFYTNWTELSFEAGKISYLFRQAARPYLRDGCINWEAAVETEPSGKYVTYRSITTRYAIPLTDITNIVFK